MGCCLSNKSSAITPDVSLIDMIQSFEQDAVIMDYINKNPKSVLESDDVSVVCLVCFMITVFVDPLYCFASFKSYRMRKRS